jgi:hypothetical protein
MAHTVKSMVLDLTGKRQPAIHGRAAEVDAVGSEEETAEKVVVKS